MMNKLKQKLISLGIIAVSLTISYAPLPMFRQTIVISVDSSLEEPLQEIESNFERDNLNIDLELAFDSTPSDSPDVFLSSNLESDSAVEIAKTFLVAVAWQERGEALFKDGIFDTEAIERAVRVKNWEEIGGKPEWGTFDFSFPNPVTSIEGKMALALWSKSFFDSFENLRLPNSSDDLIQEFVVRGVGGTDLALITESSALQYWQEDKTNYRIYYPPKIYPLFLKAEIDDSVINLDLGRGEKKAANQFISYLLNKESQGILVRAGWRYMDEDLEVRSIEGSFWEKDIPGIEKKPVGVRPRLGG